MPFTRFAVLWRTLLASSIPPFLAVGVAQAQGLQVEVPAVADVTVTENDGNPASNDASSGSHPQLNARFNAVDRNEIIALRFDLGGTNRATIEAAELQLTNFRTRENPNRPLRFWGVLDGTTGLDATTGSEGEFSDDDWPEDGVLFSTMPGLEFDADSTTRGVRSEFVTDLGLRPGAEQDVEGELTLLATEELKDFLVNHPDNIVTILLEVEAESNGQMRYGSKDATELETGGAAPAGSYAPTLLLEVVPVPFLGIDPAEAFQGDNLHFQWFAPPGSTNLMITPDIGDVSAHTDESGLGSLDQLAPAATTTYTFSYDSEGSTTTFQQEVTILEPFFEIQPRRALFNLTELDLRWRIPPNASEVILEVGSGGPPSVTFDVTGDTSLATGEGAYQVVPFEGESHYTLRFTVDSVEAVLSDEIELLEPIFDTVFPLGTVGDMEVVPALEDGVLIYQDRTNFTWADVPAELLGAQFVSPWNDDKNNANIEIEVTAAKDATLYLIVDNRVGNGEAADPPGPTLGNGVMDWAVDAGFVDTGMKITGFPSLRYSIYARPIAENETLVTGAQADGDTRVLYLLAAVAPPVETRFVASPTEIDEGAATTLHWLVPPGSDVVINQGVGDVAGFTDPVTGVGSLSVTPDAAGEVSYTLRYTPAGGGSDVSLGPVAVMVNPSTPAMEFSVTGVFRDSGTGAVELSWPAPAGVSDPASLTDTVERSLLLDGDWTPVTNGSFTISEGVVTFTDPSPPAGPQVFYRVNRP